MEVKTVHHNFLYNSITHRISPFLFKLRNKSIKSNFSMCLSEKVKIDELLYTHDYIKSNLIYKDEAWNFIKYIGPVMQGDLFTIGKIKTRQLEDNTCQNTKINIQENQVCVSSHGKKNDWVMLHFSEKMTLPYVIEFYSWIGEKFTEFQFAFNYHSIGERYRFNLRRNEELSFEVVSKGFFHNKICTAPLSLKLRQFNKFRITVGDNYLSYSVNDETILSLKQKKELLKGGSLAFILWDSNNSNISAIYKDINIYRVKI